MSLNTTILPTVVNAVRTFFSDKQYLEVFTPTIATHRIPEDHINVFTVGTSSRGNDDYVFVSGATQKEQAHDIAYLLPSPEYYHKYMLADVFLKTKIGNVGIFEIAHAYRVEQEAPRLKNKNRFVNSQKPMMNNQDASTVNTGVHGIEFLMLEYYTLGTDMEYSLQLTSELLTTMCHALDRRVPMIRRMSMKELFLDYARIDLEKICGFDSLDDIREYILLKGHELPLHKNAFGSFEEYFHYLFVHCIEPVLQEQGFVYITDYPDRIPTLCARHSSSTCCENGCKDGYNTHHEDRSKGKNDSRREGSSMHHWAQRWELYYNGLELANCYVEEVDLARIATYIASQDTHTEAPAWLSTRKQIHSSGVAMGVERIALSLSGDGVFSRGVSYGLSRGLVGVSTLQYLQEMNEQ